MVSEACAVRWGGLSFAGCALGVKGCALRYIRLLKGKHTALEQRSAGSGWEESSLNDSQDACGNISGS